MQLGAGPSGIYRGTLNTDDGLMVTIPAPMLAEIQRRDVRVHYHPDSDGVTGLLTFDWSVPAKRSQLASFAGFAIAGALVGVLTGIFFR